MCLEKRDKFELAFLSKMRAYISYSNGRSILLLAIFALLYFSQNFLPVEVRNSSIFKLYIVPGLWVVIGLLVFSFPRVKGISNSTTMTLLYGITFIGALFYVFAMIFLGLFVGFGKSPFTSSFSVILNNFFSILLPAISGELLRGYVINNNPIANRPLMVGLLTILFTLCNINIKTFTNLNGTDDVVKFIGGNLFPEFSLNFLLSNLAFIGGSPMSILYMSIITLFYYFLPVQPNLDWILKAFAASLMPFFTLMVLQYCSKRVHRRKRATWGERENPLSFIVIILFSIGMIWFVGGAFPVVPYVVATGSMEPVVFPGDIIVIRKMSANSMKLGDVIQYEKENIFIFHRIIEKVDREEGPLFRTKGDNNSGPDLDFVEAKDVRGKMVFSIPKLGYPTLLLKKVKLDNSVDRSKVEF